MTDERLARLYLRTLVSIEEGGHLVEAAVSPMAMGQVVHVITAWNPGEARPARHENDAASRRLRQVLVDRGLAPRRAVGADPDSDHAEESWAVSGLDDQEARAIGASFGQVAVFRISGGTQTVLACDGDWSLSRPL